jgi:hypothetical protein
VKQNKVGTSVISSYDYSVNAIGQSTGVANSGSAFSALLTWALNHDVLGNREKSADSLSLPIAVGYSTNVLNQCTSWNMGVSPGIILRNPTSGVSTLEELRKVPSVKALFT